jgi:colanic acid/amylovoran biosynthesis glycosyltransferase
MLTVAYLANEFPSPFEPYVSDEIAELRGRGVQVIAASAWRSQNAEAADIVLTPVRLFVLFRALWLCARRWKRIAPLLRRVLLRGREMPWRRAKALAHTLLGACYAVRLEERGVEHIHVHHGYFGSWIAMTAARLLGVEFSLTLLGSDLLLHAAYLDAKLRHCAFCLTISDYNRRYILEHYPEIQPAKVVVSRLGVDVPAKIASASSRSTASNEPLRLLTVGRLHAVKNHEFLVRACERLCKDKVDFECVIAGRGPEHGRLESLIRESEVGQRVRLLGYVPQEQMDSLYDSADVVVLTSRSEGIPLALMEAMARGKIVLAPAITGIPELVVDGKTGFLYNSGSLDDFVRRLLFIRSLLREEGAERPHALADLPEGRSLEWIRHAARVHVQHNFNRAPNLASFANLFLQRIILTPQNESVPSESFVLQQIQLSVQRNRSVPV